ncbi:hypothetical protein NX794_32985 [Streptomyces sp. LP11]|uniref:Uncharacterized protein n=1 Tax=Streptomyces pyxinicus TaxID=2970331 RepID=A0ABT2BC13_9ACTN|nr:hypothetical protein [Streptomyces sp. LP11]MCS0605987.1 hypothetical protein [Streptomyces sp. LP11]
MIRTTITCQRDNCLALYLPDTDAGADVLERAARALGWRRTGNYSHACPGCVAGQGPVLERGQCPTCTGMTVDLPQGSTCRYCQTVTPHTTY